MFTSPDTQGDYPQWLQVIHEVNETRPGTFLDPQKPQTGEQWDGRYVEDYPEAWVVFPPESERFQEWNEDSVVIVKGKTSEVEQAIDRAARKLGFAS